MAHGGQGCSQAKLAEGDTKQFSTSMLRNLLPQCSRCTFCPFCINIMCVCVCLFMNQPAKMLKWCAVQKETIFLSLVACFLLLLLQLLCLCKKLLSHVFPIFIYIFCFVCVCVCVVLFMNFRANAEEEVICIYNNSIEKNMERKTLINKFE